MLRIIYTGEQVKFTTFLIVLALGVIHWFAATAWMRDTGLNYSSFWSAGLKVWWEYHLPRLSLSAGAAVVTAVVILIVLRKK